MGWLLALFPLKFSITSKIEDLTLPFNTGDILVFYTDGLTEVTNKRNEEFSNQRLMQVLSKEHTKDAQGILNQLLDAVKTFSNEKVAQDDQTILVVKHK